MLKETIVKLDDNGAEVKVNESGVTITGKSINLSTNTEHQSNTISSDEKGNLHVDLKNH